MDKAIFNKIEKLQEQYGITKSVYTTVMLAIIQMDYLQDITQNQTESKEQNRKKLNIDTFCNTVINEIYFNSVLDVDMITNSIDSNISNNILPDVQQFRLLLDTLTYCVARDFKDKLPKDVKFTMPSTGRVAKLENVNLCHCDYSDIKECDYFLGLYKLDLEQRENNFDTFLRDIEKLIQGTFDKIDTLNISDLSLLFEKSKYKLYLNNSKLFKKTDGLNVDIDYIETATYDIFRLCFTYMVFNRLVELHKKDNADIFLLMSLHKFERENINCLCCNFNMYGKIYSI